MSGRLDDVEGEIDLFDMTALTVRSARADIVQWGERVSVAARC